ncbi:MAG: hypothetical protein AAGF75_05875 [Cyanobacteria bacterium P01_H01_bin.130]
MALEALESELSPDVPFEKAPLRPTLTHPPLQRISHIFNAYQLWGAQSEQVQQQVIQLLDQYPAPLMELAIAEVLVQQWLTALFPRGTQFIDRVHQWLDACATVGISLTVLPPQFQAITGLEPHGVYSQLPKFLVWDGDRLHFPRRSDTAPCASHD